MRTVRKRGPSCALWAEPGAPWAVSRRWELQNLDSEQFRSTPRTCHGVGGRLRMRRTAARGEALVSGIRRRDFVILLGGGAAAAWPLAARAQQPATPVIGFLDSRSPDGMTERVRVFRQGLQATGLVEG